MMQDVEIIDAILVHLQGYVVESQTELSDLDYDKMVSSEEVLALYGVTYAYVLSYLNIQEFPMVTRTDNICDGEGNVIDTVDVEVIDPIIFAGLTMWTAGKLWQKYNVRVNNNEDETNVLGYGDKLVIQAKELLKPYKYYKLNIF